MKASLSSNFKKRISKDGRKFKPYLKHLKNLQSIITYSRSLSTPKVYSNSSKGYQKDGRWSLMTFLDVVKTQSKSVKITKSKQAFVSMAKPAKIEQLFWFNLTFVDGCKAKDLSSSCWNGEVLKKSSLNFVVIWCRRLWSKKYWSDSYKNYKNLTPFKNTSPLTSEKNKYNPE